MTILLYDLVGADAARPFSPHCWKAAMALAHKGLDFGSVPTRFLEVPTVEGGVSKTVPVIRDGDAGRGGFLRHRALSRRGLSRPADAVRRRGRRGDGALHRALVATDHPSLSRRRRADGHPRQAGRRQTRPISARAARRASASGWRTVAAGARCRRSPRSAPSLEPLRSMLTYQPFIGGAVAALRRLHRVRRVPVGARHLALPAARRRTIRWRDWFERCLDLHGGLGRAVPAAA